MARQADVDVAARMVRSAIMRIAIVGAGGVGGYFGGRLLATGDVDVTFLARGAHLDALRTRGLRITSPLGNLQLPPVNATDDPSAIGPVDVVFFAVKLYDTESAIRLLPPLIGSDTVVIPFQNGVDSVDVLTRAVGRRACRRRHGVRRCRDHRTGRHRAHGDGHDRVRRTGR